jgi:hypothetical protein
MQMEPTLMFSAKDPGVWNWVDTDGMHLGTYTIRWQRLADSSSVADKAVRDAKVLSIADLKKVLPPETVWLNDVERRQQQAERAASFALRLAN